MIMKNKESADKFKIGDKINYAFYNNVLISSIDENYYYLTDIKGVTQPVYKYLIEKYGIKTALPTAKTRYNAKTRRIAFALNIEQTKQMNEMGLSQKEANALAKMLFLQYIKPSE